MHRRTPQIVFHPPHTRARAWCNFFRGKPPPEHTGRNTGTHIHAKTAIPLYDLRSPTVDTRTHRGAQNARTQGTHAAN